MITTNVYQRTFRIKYQNSVGTCFTIDIDNKQYIVTAKHVVQGISDHDKVEIFYNGNWHEVNTEISGHCPGEIDITVFALDFQLSPPYPLPADSTGIINAQDVYFLGFPFGLGAEVGGFNRNFPLPFVKRATLSCIVPEKTRGTIFYLDGNNNPGFSGGPVVFAKHLKLNDWNVAAVISGYRFDPQPVYIQDQPTQLMARHNTGIIISYEIRHAVDVIRSNPNGFQLDVTSNSIT